MGVALPCALLFQVHLMTAQLRISLSCVFLYGNIHYSIYGKVLRLDLMT